MASVVMVGFLMGAWAKPREIRLPLAPVTSHPLYALDPRGPLPRGPDPRGAVRSRRARQLPQRHRRGLVGDNALVTLTLAKRKWHDGRPLVAADVCATITRVRAVDRPTPYTAAANAQIADCSAADPKGSTVRITLVKPMSEPRAALVFPLVPAHRSDWAGAGPQSTIQPIGLGPYAAEPDDNGWSLRGDGSTKLKKIHLSVVPDPAAAVAEGRGIGAPFVDPAELATVRAAPELALNVVPAEVVWALFVNQTRGPLADPAVRAALDLLIDRDHLAGAIYGRDTQLATQPWTPVSGPFLPRSPRVSAGVPVTQRDVDGARSLLTAAGLTRTDDGWSWNGQPWTLRVATPLGLGPDPELLKKALTEELDGLPVEVLPLSATQWWFSLLAGGHVQSTDLALVPIDPYDPGASFHTRTATEGIHNPFGWADPGDGCAADCLLEDDDQGHALHGRLADVHPALFLWTLDGRAAWRSGYGFESLDPRTLTPTAC